MQQPIVLVLIVDDELSDAADLETYLREQGISAEAVDDEERAVKKIRDERPAILVIDVGAPSIDSVRVLKLFQELSAQPTAALVANSGRKGLVERCCAGLVDVEIHKPFSQEKREICEFIYRIMRSFNEPAVG